MLCCLWGGHSPHKHTRWRHTTQITCAKIKILQNRVFFLAIGQEICANFASLPFRYSSNVSNQKWFLLSVYLRVICCSFQKGFFLKRSGYVQQNSIDNRSSVCSSSSQFNNQFLLDEKTAWITIEAWLFHLPRANEINAQILSSLLWLKFTPKLHTDDLGVHFQLLFCIYQLFSNPQKLNIPDRQQFDESLGFVYAASLISTLHLCLNPFVFVDMVMRWKSVLLFLWLLTIFSIKTTSISIELGVLSL